MFLAYTLNLTAEQFARAHAWVHAITVNKAWFLLSAKAESLSADSDRTKNRQFSASVDVILFENGEVVCRGSLDLT